MANKTVTEVIETKEHPLEDFFGIESNTTEVTTYEQKTELVKDEEYDAKDAEIEGDFQEVYDKAISGYENLQEQMEDIEPKYVSRAHEVANQLLGTALQAAAKKADLKQHKDKLKVSKAKIANGPTGGTTIVLDTSTLIQHLKRVKPIDVEATDVTPVTKPVPVLPQIPPPLEVDDSDDNDEG
jgi:hypothetical protein